MRRREFNKALTMMGMGTLWKGRGVPEMQAYSPTAIPGAEAAGVSEQLGTLRFTRTHYEINGRPAFLYSGELPYFRVPKAAWRERMELFKAAGGNAVSTYIPWVLHEPEEGRFVFGGEDGVRDLEGYLETAKAAGLYVIARPGPYQYSELLYCGLPGWLCENYPQLLAHTIEGKSFNISAISYVHPLFLERAKAWYAHVCPVIARHTVSRGGAVAMMQLDNELTGIHIWLSGLDYNVESMGFGKSDGRFPRFLRQRFDTIQDLNREYGTDFASFEAVRPIASSSSGNAGEIRRLKDYFDFYLETVAEYASTLGKWARECGVDAPLIHNAGGPDAYFEETARALGPQFFLGDDNYYALDQTWAQNNPTPQWAVSTFCLLEPLRLMGYPPTILELAGGSPWDWPPLTPHDLKACYWVNLAFGMKGSNFYIFSGGPNPPGIGALEVYDFHAAVSPTGEIRPSYEVQKELGLFLKSRPWMTLAERETDFRLAYDSELTRSAFYWKQRGDFLLHGAEANSFLGNGVLTSALCGSLSPALCDLGSDDWVGDRTSPVLIVSSSAMSRAKQERVVKFLRQGGKALITPVLPEYDERLAPCRVLMDYLGSPVMKADLSQVPRVTIENIPNILSNGSLFVTTRMPDGAERRGIEEHSGQTVAWQLQTDGGGQVIVLGMRWMHAANKQDQMLQLLLERLGLEKKVSCSSPYIWTSLLSTPERSTLFLINLFTAPMEADVSCRPRSKTTSVSLGRQTIDAMSVKYIDL